MTSDAAVLTWEPQSAEPNWAVRYKVADSTEWADTIYVANDTMVLSDLNAATDYEVQVATQCDPEDASAIGIFSATISFTTKCAAVAAIEEGFEDASTLKCYSIIGETYNIYTYPAIINNAALAYEGTKALYFLSQLDGTPADQYGILPELISLDGKRIKFFARKEEAADEDIDIFVGIMTDPQDTATFVALDTISINSLEYALFSVPFAGYEGDGKYVAIMMPAASTGNATLLVDNVVVDDVPGCPEASGLKALLTLGDGTVATLTWKAGENENAWVVEYSTDAEFAEATAVNAADSTILAITGLTAEATYYARVKAVCGAGNEGAWSDVLTFVPTNALYKTINDSTATNGFVPVYGYYVDNFSKSQFIIPADSLAGLQWANISELTFYASQASINWGVAEFEVYVKELPDSVSTISALGDYASMEKVMNAAHLSVADNQMVVTFSAPYQYRGGNLMIGFLQTVKGTYGTSTWYGITATGASMGGYGTSVAQKDFLPKMTIKYIPGEEPTCLKPTDVAVSEITPHTALVNWVSDADAWQIMLSGDEANLIDADSVPFMLSGLVADSAYTIQVRTNCGGLYSDWTNAADLHTAIACFAPKNLEAILTPGNGTIATLQWNAGKDENEWTVEYSTNEDMSNAVIIAELADSTVALEGLTAEATYYARVKSNCGEEGESAYSATISFKPTSAMSLTINDSTATNGYVPFYGFYADHLTHSKFIVPASNLEAVQWGTINELTFYLSSPASKDFGNARFEVYMAEVPETTVSALGDFSSMTQVMTAKALFIENNKMVVTLDAPFAYEGGNLMIGFNQTVVGGYATTTWYGKTATGASMSNYDSNTAAQRNFLPKMTIAYLPGEAPSCMQVKDVAATVTATSATISWTNGAEDQNAWQIAYSQDVNFDPASITPIEAASNPYVLGELTPETTYYIYVRANCGEDGFSAWSALKSFQTVSSCQTPDNLAADSITISSASISWNTYGQTGFNLRYIHGTDTVVVNNVVSPHELSDLEANSTYKVQVQVTCEAEQNTWSAVYSFKTPCVAWSIAEDGVYTENFDSYTGTAYNAAGVTPDCWEVGGSSTYVPHIVTGTSYAWAHSGANAFGFTGSANSYCYAVLPQFEEELNRLQISFWSRMESASYGTLSLGYITADADVIHRWKTYTNATSMTFHEEMLDTIPAEATRLILLWEYTGSSFYSCTIDDITVEFIPSCLKPTDVNATNIMGHKATISWTPGTEDQNAWQIAYDTKATANPDTLANILDVTANPFVLENLNPATTYYVYVRANCGEDDFSKWSDGKSFRTTVACPAPKNLKAVLTPGNGTIATLNWTAGGDEQSWIVEYSMNANMSDSIVAIVSDTTIDLEGLIAETTYYARVLADCGELDSLSAYSAVVSFTTTNAYLLTVNDGTSTNQYVPIFGTYVDEGTRSQFILPEEQLEAIEWDSIRSFTFYSSAASVDWGAATFEVYLAEAENATMSSWTAWENMTLVKSEGTLSVVGNKMVVALDEPYQYQGGNLLIGFKQNAIGSYVSAPWYGVTATGASMSGYGNNANAQRNFLPKVTIDYVPGVGPACPNPKKLAVASVEATTAKLTWKAVEGAAWEYAYVAIPADDFIPADEDFVETTADSVVLSDLNDLTDYVFYLRKACGEDGNSEIISVAFKTAELIEAVPYTDNFEAGNTWKLINGDLENAWVYGDNSLYISNDGVTNAYTMDEAPATVFAAKLFNFDKDTTYVFEYDWKANGEEGADYLRVVLVPATENLEPSAEGTEGLGPDALPAGWMALDGGEALYGVDEWQHVSVDLALEAGLYKVAFVWTNDFENGEDAPAAVNNFSIAYKTCQQPTELAASNITSNSATINWTSEGANAWQLAYSTEADADPDELLALDAASNPYELAGLNVETTYYIYVRANCGNGIFSAWSAAAQFTTEPECVVTGKPEEGVLCDGVPYVWNGKEYTEPGEYVDTLRSVAGCDSIAYLVLTECEPQCETVYAEPIVEKLCAGTPYTWKGVTYTVAGMYRDTTVMESGCDSIETLILSYYADAVVADAEVAAICDGASYEWYGIEYSATGIYHDTLYNVAGCDSLYVTLNLTVIPAQDPATIVTEQETICQGESFEWNGETYTETGIYSVTLTSAAGCDSIVKLDLTVYAIDTIRVAQTIKDKELPYTYENAEHPYIAGQAPISYAAETEPGEYVDSAYVEGEHCDALLILTLTIQNTEGFENIYELDGKSVEKVIYQDKLYIICNDEWYNAEGKKVADPRY